MCRWSDMRERPNPFGICPECAKAKINVEPTTGREWLYCEHNKAGAVWFVVSDTIGFWQIATPCLRDDFVLAIKAGMGGVTMVGGAGGTQ